MEGQKAVSPTNSLFMCRLCNLFSPSRSQLLAHCSQVHPQQEHPDDIIITLQPLVGEPVGETPEGQITSPVKRKRGRPKGSTKKACADSTQGKDDSTEDVKKRKKEEEDRQHSLTDGESHDVEVALECRDCHRSFSNRRQILKHICVREEPEEEEQEEKGNSGGKAGMEGSGSSDAGATDLKQMQRNSAKLVPVRERDVGNSRPPRTNRSRVSKGGGLVKGNIKQVISVVLKEDETLPGISTMVPVEDISAETEVTAFQAQSQQSAVFQSQSQDPASEATTSEANPKTDQAQDSSTDLTTTTTTNTTTVTKTTASIRGFQEYSIKQDSTNLLQSQLKIFACEFCNKIFKFRHSLVAHLRTHTQEKPFQCPHCDYASAIKANLNVHLRKHTGEKFSCPECPFNCLSPGHLKVHIERVHMKVKQHCGFCEKKYSDVKNLLKHIEKRHDLNDPDVCQSYQQLRLKTRQGLRQLLYHCPTCNRRFKNQLERQRHLLVHGPLRPYACLLCDHASTKMAALEAHVRKHLFLYVCSMCDGKFVSSQRLKGHLEESHPETDRDKTFAECIDSSYYLDQPGEGMWGDEGREEDKEDGTGNELPKDCERERTREQLEVAAKTECAKSNGSNQIQSNQDAEAEKEENGAHPQGDVAGGVHQGEREAPQEIPTKTTTPSDGAGETTAGEKKPQESSAGSCNPSAQENTPTVSSAEGIEVSPPDERTQENTRTTDEKTHTEEEGPTPHSEMASEVFHESAFQQVFSSLQKTRLNMEYFQRLRKIYGDLECQYCGKLFWYKVHYNVHVRTHTKEHLHYCSKCSYSSITKSSLKRHNIQKHSGLLLPCSSPDCKYTTPDKYKLQAHLKTHQEPGKSVPCPVCQQCYPEHRLKHHVKTCHPDAMPLQGKGLMVQRAEKCPYCDSYFLKNSSDFQRHIWAHEGLKPFVCNVCDYAGRSRSNLKTHMNRHNTERRHLCDLCGKKFKSKVTLKSHRLSHTNEGKRFQCSECDFTSVSKPSLLRHMEQHADFKPFRCAHCRYSCNIVGPLKRHYKIKHPEEKYENAGPGLPNPDALKEQGGMKCPECDFVYGTKWELNRHLKNKHNLKVVEGSWEVGESVKALYVSVENEEQMKEAPGVLQENVNIQQITELSSETHNAVTSMVAMAPGTVTVVQQLQVAEEQEVSSNQVMVVNSEGGLTGDQVMVVEEGHGLEGLTVLTQGENTHHYIVYVQEHTVEIN